MEIIGHAPALHTVAPASRPSRLTTPDRAWRRAKVQLEQAIEAAKPLSRAHGAAEKREVAARKALEHVRMPRSLTVRVSAHLHFKDDLGEDFERHSTRSVALKSEAEISQYARDNGVLKKRLLAALGAWHARRAPFETSAQAAKAEEEVAEQAWMRALDRCDRALLRLLKTSSPGLLEINWKIHTLRRQDCSDAVEQAGWSYVLEEMTAAIGCPEPLPQRL